MLTAYQFQTIPLDGQEYVVPKFLMSWLTGRHVDSPMALAIKTFIKSHDVRAIKQALHACETVLQKSQQMNGFDADFQQYNEAMRSLEHCHAAAVQGLWDLSETINKRGQGVEDKMDRKGLRRAEWYIKQLGETLIYYHLGWIDRLLKSGSTQPATLANALVELDECQASFTRYGVSDETLLTEQARLVLLVAKAYQTWLAQFERLPRPTLTTESEPCVSRPGLRHWVAHRVGQMRDKPSPVHFVKTRLQSHTS